MTTKQHKEMARRLAVRGIEAYKQRMIYEENLLNGEDKRVRRKKRILELRWNTSFKRTIRGVTND